MKTLTIIVGPAGSGKTFNAAAFKKHFNADRVVDEWDGVSRLEPGDLALYQGVADSLAATAPLIAAARPGGGAVTVISIENARAEIGA